MKPFSMKWLTVPVTCSLALLVTACSQSPSLTLPALANSNNKAAGTIIWRDHYGAITNNVATSFGGICILISSIT